MRRFETWKTDGRGIALVDYTLEEALVTGCCGMHTSAVLHLHRVAILFPDGRTRNALGPPGDGEPVVGRGHTPHCPIPCFDADHVRAEMVHAEPHFMELRRANEKQLQGATRFRL